MPLGDNFLTNGELKLIYQWLYAGAPEFGIVASDTLLNDTTRYQLPEFKPLTPPAAGKGMQFHLGHLMCDQIQTTTENFLLLAIKSSRRFIC